MFRSNAVWSLIRGPKDGHLLRSARSGSLRRTGSTSHSRSLACLASDQPSAPGTRKTVLPGKASSCSHAKSWMSRGTALMGLVALSTGAMAPDFEALSSDGQKVTLSALRGKGPVVLVFLRGFS